MLNTKLGKAYGGQLFWKTWNWIDIEQLAKVWKFSDSMYNYLQRPNLVFASRLPAMTLKTCTLGHPKYLNHRYWRNWKMLPSNSAHNWKNSYKVTLEKRLSHVCPQSFADVVQQHCSASSITFLWQLPSFFLLLQCNGHH